jgi:hypothetical protein
METAQHMQDPSPLCINSHVPVACPSCPLSKAATTVGWKFHIIIEVAEGSPVCHIQLYMPTLPPALRSLAAWITCKYLPMACKANSPHLPSPSEPLSLCPAILRHVTPDRPSSGSPRSPHPCSGTAHHSIRECPHVRLLWALVTGHYRTAPTTLPSLPHTHRHPAPVTRATSANTTRDCPAEARMLTALSIEQYSFSTFTTLLYRPPCGGIALDVYNYS